MKEAFATESIADALWAYTVKVYAREGVAKECLALQDEFEMDVNLLLSAAFCAEAKLPWSAALVADLRSASAAIRRDFILPMRELRRNAKHRAPSPAYRQIQAAELALERWQLASIAALLPSRAAAGGPECIPNNLLICAPDAGVALRERLMGLAERLRA